MSFRLGILGGGLQGTEAAALARWSGWETVLADARPAPPAKDLAGRFVNRSIETLSALDRAFPGCDLVIPACEDLPTLELLDQWSRLSGQPLAFDLAAYHISSDKARSKELFFEAEIPTPRPAPEAEYPLIAKPVSGSGSRGVRLLASAAEYRDMFPEGDHQGWVVEEYCPGPSYSLEVTGEPGRHQAWLTTALEMDEVYDCRQVRAPAGLTPEEDRRFREISLAIAGALNLRGLMDVEVILTPRGFRVLEIDARLPSQTPTVVYWSSGENLIARLAELQGALPPPPPSGSKPRAVIYEQVAVTPDSAVSAGEHVLATAGPLWLHENFQGADWALTNFQAGRGHWVATLILIDDDEAALHHRRDEILARLARRP